jgi:hypothetical protein
LPERKCPPVSSVCAFSNASKASLPIILGARIQKEFPPQLVTEATP